MDDLLVIYIFFLNLLWDMPKSSKTTQILIANILFSSVIKENTGASVFMFSEVHTAFGNIFLEVGGLMQCETGLLSLKILKIANKAEATRVEENKKRNLATESGNKGPSTVIINSYLLR